MEWFPSVTPEIMAVLDRPVSAVEVASYRQRTGLSRWSLGFDFVGGESLLFPMLFVAAALGIVSATSIAPNVALGLLAVLLIIGAALLIVFAMLYYTSQRAIRRHVRMHDFAARCGLAYDPIGQFGAIGTGLIFQIGHSRRYRGVLSYGRDGQRLFETGLYRYETGSGKQHRTHIWQYAALRLPRQLPHVVLDAADYDKKIMGKLAVNNLPAFLNWDRRISLEGDFDKYFTLYGPQGYDVDVRYILTPDVMASLIAASSQFDIEIMDDLVFFFTPHGEVMANESRLLGELMHAVAVAGRELYDQVDNYADDRVANARTANVVAEQGRRLWL